MFERHQAIAIKERSEREEQEGGSNHRKSQTGAENGEKKTTGKGAECETGDSKGKDTTKN
jgi:hypothetical protein